MGLTDTTVIATMAGTGQAVPAAWQAGLPEDGRTSRPTDPRRGAFVHWASNGFVPQRPDADGVGVAERRRGRGRRARRAARVAVGKVGGGKERERNERVKKRVSLVSEECPPRADTHLGLARTLTHLVRLDSPTELVFNLQGLFSG